MKNIIPIVGFCALFCSAFGMQPKNIIMQNNKLSTFLSTKCCNSTIVVARKSSDDIINTMIKNDGTRHQAIYILNILSISDEKQQNAALHAAKSKDLKTLKDRLLLIFSRDCRKRICSTKDCCGHRKSLAMSIIDYPEKCKTVATLLLLPNKEEINQYLIKCINGTLMMIITSIATSITNNSNIKDSITAILKKDTHAYSASDITGIFLQCCTPTLYFKEYYYDLIYKIASDIIDNKELRDEMLMLLS